MDRLEEVLAELHQANLITSEECEELYSSRDVVYVQRDKSPEVLTKTADILQRHGFEEDSKLLTDQAVFAEMRQANLITSKEWRGLHDPRHVVTVQSGKSPEVLTKTADVLQRHGFEKESKLLAVFAELQQADLITGEECEELYYPRHVVQVQRGKSPEVHAKTADVLRRHGFVEESNLLIVLAELVQDDLITSEECRGLRDRRDVVRVQSGKSPEALTKTADVLRRHGIEKESNLLAVLAELQQADLITSEECEELYDPRLVVIAQSGKSTEVVTKTADVLWRHGFEEHSNFLAVLAELQQANLITSKECNGLYDPSDVVQVQSGKFPDILTKTADVLQRHGFEEESKHLTVLAQLQQANLITNEECEGLWHLSGVVEVQSNKSPEVLTKTADVLRRHGIEEESNLLTVQAVLAKLPQADMITTKECKGLHGPSDVDTVQSSKSPEVLTKTADDFGRHGFKEESNLLTGQEVHEFEENLREFQEHYSEVVHNQASVILNITKCTTIGPPRIGKTGLKHLLTGQEWDVEAGTDSTDVMEAPEWVECYNLEEGGAEKQWKLLTAKQQQGELLRAVNTLNTSSTELINTPSDVSSTTTPSNALPTTTRSDVQHLTTPSEAQYPTTPSDAPPTNKPSNAQHPASDTHFKTTPSSAPPPFTKPDAVQKPATVRQALEALASACSREALQDFLKDKEGKVLGETHLVHFIDTGGQAIYHDVHPVLITSPSVYLVVFSLKELYVKKSRKEQLEYFRSDLIQRPLRSIYTFGTKNPKEDHLLVHPETPIIFIVGTHLDQIPEQECEETLSTLHKMISKEIGNKPYRGFVQYDTKGRSFWAVDNTQAGKEQSEEFKKYISKLRMMVQEKSMEMSVKVPLPWLLLKEVMEGKGVRYCKYSELLAEARIRCYVREHSANADLDTMLRLFHVLGLFYHKVPKGCKKEDSLVFINPNCLYSATSSFLMATKEEIEDSQGGSEEGQHQTQAATKEEMEDSQGGSEERQHKTKAATKEEMEDSHRDSEVGQHQTKAATKEETEDTRAGGEEGLHLTQAAIMKKRCHEETAKVGIRQQKPEWGRIVTKAVIQRMEDNVESVKHEMERVLQIVNSTMAKIDMVTTDLEKLHAQLKEIGQDYNVAIIECLDVSSVKAKQQLFIKRLIHSLASSVKAVLDDSGRKGNVHHVLKEVNKAVENIRMQYQSRSIDSCDMDQFLSILSDLRIVARLRNPDICVVQAAMPWVPHSVEIAGKFAAASILFTVVSQTIIKVCFIPSGLFCCLISELVTGLGWTVYPQGRTHVAFTHMDLSGKVHIIEHESYIEIKLESEASLLDLSETCQCVREKIHKHVVNVYENLYSDPTADTAFEESLVWGFQCEEHPDDDTHIAAFHEDDNECCAKCLLPRCRWMQAVTPKQQVWFSEISLTDIDFQLIKCITIQTQDVVIRGQQQLNDNWVQYMQLTPQQILPLRICEKSDWLSADNGHVLLHIDIPTQVYPLPLLITPSQCVYIVTFDLHEKKEYQTKALKRLHNTLSDVYTYSCVEPGLNKELCCSPQDPKVLLVGIQTDNRDKSAFAEQVKKMLEARPYNKLIVPPEGGDPYWTNHGAELSIYDNAALLSKIQDYSYQPTQRTRQLLIHHCELVEKFKDNRVILYEDFKAKVPDVVSDITDSSSLEEFLEVLHCLGLIFYRSLPVLAQSENVVVLQPQYVYQLFEEVQKLSKERERVSTADLFTAAATSIPDYVQKWFQAVCIDMNLVIELPTGDRADYIFVIGLEWECSPPERVHYSVAPLLVTYRFPGREQMHDDYFLPSPLFPTFISAFLKKLKKRDKIQRETTAMTQHYLHVDFQSSTQIHVVERESFIEIGVQQFHMGKLNNSEQLKKLQQSCQGIYSIVSKSAESATTSLKLDSTNLQYGFCHPENTEPGDRFDKFHQEMGTVTHSYCKDPQDMAPQQQIWFSNVDHQKVRVRHVTFPGSNTPIRKLEAVSETQSSSDQTNGQSNIPSNPPCAPDGTIAQPKQTQPDLPEPTQIPPAKAQLPPLSQLVTAEQVLGHFRKRFVEEVNANIIAFELVHEDIIADGDQKAISKKDDAAEQSQFLHAHLVRTCTREALMTVCNVIISVKGNPKMRALGKDMKDMLEGSVPARAQLGQGPLRQAPLGQAPLGQPPHGHAPLGHAPLGHELLGQAPLGQAPLAQAQLGQAPLGQAQLRQAPLGQAQLMQTVTDHPNHVMLFRVYVSRKASGKARAVLEGLGLDSSVIAACFQANPQNDEETVQEGLTRWKDGQGIKPPTWGVLIKAMEYAQVEQQSVQSLEKELVLLV